MFQFDKNLRPENLVLIDWQLSRYASPVLDLAYNIYTSSDKDLRDNHLERLLDQYYKTFSEFVQRLGSRPEQLFPHEEFQKQWKAFGKFGMLMSLTLVPFITCPSDQMLDMDKAVEDFASSETKDILENGDFKAMMDSSAERVGGRIKDIVLDCERSGII